MQFPTLRRWLQSLKMTPLHPQWLIFRQEQPFLEQVARTAHGNVLDIGAGRQTIRPFLNPSCHYFPLDYYDTVVNWYNFWPDIFADAQALPLKQKTMDTILILDVLEHLPRPDSCLSEMYRVLKPGGQLIIQVPFLYPLHDAPLDFQRWTLFGLKQLAHKHQFTIDRQEYQGTPIETALLLLNIALSKTILNWIAHKNVLAVLGLLLPFILIINNLLAFLGGILISKDHFMPHSYQLWLTKKS